MKRLLAALTFLFALTALPALAANCASYPYTLTNGQTADANQVMANFNSILNCGNTNLAKNGANSDITSLTGLTTPLSVAQGGTGSTTASVNGVTDKAGTAISAAHMVTGTASGLVTGGNNVILTNGAIFTSASSYFCTASDANNSGAVGASQLAGNRFQIIVASGATTTAANYICIGN